MQNRSAKGKLDLPVVTRADLMAAGDQFWCADLMRATIPATWGQAIEVPDSSAKPLLYFVWTGGYAAKMSTPGAAMSGYPHQSACHTDTKGFPG